MKPLEDIFKTEKLYSISEVQDFLEYCDDNGYYYEFLDEDTSVVGFGDILVNICNRTFKLIEVCVNCYQSKYKLQECA